MSADELVYLAVENKALLNKKSQSIFPITGAHTHTHARDKFTNLFIWNRNDSDIT